MFAELMMTPILEQGAGISMLWQAGLVNAPRMDMTQLPPQLQITKE